MPGEFWESHLLGWAYYGRCNEHASIFVLVRSPLRCPPPLSPSQTHIQTEVDHQLKVQAIPAYLESILLNLLTNAIKYRKPETELKIKIIAKEIDNLISLEVIDNGLGMDLNKIGEKLFGMYKTFHQHKDSRGIGLFITKNQIEALMI